jgi:hypothetical protein
MSLMSSFRRSRRALRSASMRLPLSGQRSWRPLLWKSKPNPLGSPARAAKRARIASRPVKDVFARDNCGRRV